MKKLLVVLVLMVSSNPGYGDAPKPIQIEGKSAQQLISLLANSGNSFMQQLNAGKISVKNIECNHNSTFKFDDDAPIADIDLYRCDYDHRQVANGKKMNDPSSLYPFFLKIGAKEGVGLGAHTIDITQIDCEIHVKEKRTSPSRFHCTVNSTY